LYAVRSRKIAEHRARLVPEYFSPTTDSKPAAVDPYHWWRFPMQLVEQGFCADYLSAAAADIEAAAVFLFLKNDYKSHVERFLFGR